jgi:hypothetical protein
MCLYSGVSNEDWQYINNVCPTQDMHHTWEANFDSFFNSQGVKLWIFMYTAVLKCKELRCIHGFRNVKIM